MCHLNRYSVLTEYFQASTSELSFFVCLAMKWIFYVKLCFSSIIIIFLIPALQANPQENKKSELKTSILEDSQFKIESNQIITEDILSDTDSELGFVEDPKVSNESESTIQKWNVEENGSEVRFEEEFFDSSESESETVVQKDNLELSNDKSSLESDLLDLDESESDILKANLEENETDFHWWRFY